MFDISFVELAIVAVVALLVIGPERLPETVRAVTMWIGRVKRSLRDTRREIEQQLGTDEIRAQLHNEEIMRNLEKMRSQMDELKKEVRLESELFTDNDKAAEPDSTTSNLDSQQNDSGAGEQGAEASDPPPEQKHS